MRPQRQTLADSSYTTYGYGDDGQLAAAQGYNAAGSLITAEDLAFRYDPSLNMTQRIVNTVPSAYKVNDLNEVTNAAGSSCSYDPNGNRTIFGGYYNYSHDDENRLTQLSDDVYQSFRTQWVYDGLGRLRKRLEYDWGTTTARTLPAIIGAWQLSSTTLYIYDGNLAVQERSGANVLQVTYTRGKDLSGSLAGAGGIGGLLARSDVYSNNGSWSSHNFYLLRPKFSS